MLKPREMVFKLNAGGDAIWLGVVERPPEVLVVVAAAAAAAVPMPTPVVGVVVVDEVLPGDTSGDSTPANTLSDRFSPYCSAPAVDLENLDVEHRLQPRALSFC